MSEVRVLTIRRGWVRMSALSVVYLTVKHLIELIKSDALVSICVQTANNCNNFRLCGSIAIHTTEIHEVIVAKETFSSVINCLKRPHI